MTKFTMVALGILGVLALTVLTLVVGYVGFTNTANRFENSIQAKYTDNQNVYDNGWKSVQELAQVPALQVKALQDIFKTALEARYGDNGAQAMFQFIQEQNPTLDQSTFVKIQQQIQAFRAEFASNQTALVSQKQEYTAYLTATTSGRFYNMLGGYPRIDMTKFDIVTSDKTQQDFGTKRAEPLTIGR